MYQSRQLWYVHYKINCHVALYIDTCSLSVNSGPCQGTYPHWFFNSTSRQCEHFSYGGCGGNSNRFGSLQQCIDSCGK